MSTESDGYVVQSSGSSSWARRAFPLGVSMALFGALFLLTAWILPLEDYSDASFLGENLWDGAGTRVAMVGDVNGDGFGDFLIGATGGRAEGYQRGVAYLFLGRPAADWGSGFDIAQADAWFYGEVPWSVAGQDVSAAGDVNGDGYDDFLIGAFHYTAPGPVTETGKVYLFLGRAAADWGTGVSLANADASFVGQSAYDYLGKDIDAAGDVNGDGYDDFVIGASRNDARGLVDSGKACLFLGRAAANWGQNVPMSSADASFVGEATGDYAGSAVAGAGDVNGDGYDDLVIGAYLNDDAANNAGKAYLILGRADPNWGTDYVLAGADAAFLGERSTSYAGDAAAGIGDVNGDGLDDLAIAARYDSESGSFAGQSYLVLGRRAAHWGLGFSLANADASYRGVRAGDESGSALAGAGDVNGDGYADWLIGAYRFEATASLTDTGRAYLVLGKPGGWTMDTDLASADGASDVFAFDGEARDDQAGTGVGGGGDVNGDGLADLLFGAPGNDQNGDGSGKAYLVLGRGLTLDKAASSDYVLPGQRITYTMRYANTNLWAVEAVRVVDHIPDAVQYLGCAGGITCTRQGPLVTWLVGNIISETSGLVRMVVAVQPGTPLGTVITNTAWITAPSRLGPAFSEVAITVGVQPSTPTPTATATRTRTPTATPTAPVTGCVPSLVSPAPGAVLDNGRQDYRDVIEWDFDWGDCPGATYYHLMVALGSGIPIIDVQNLPASSYHFVEYNSWIADPYRFGCTWKVRAMVGGQWGPWSETRTFDLEPVDSDPPMEVSTPTRTIPSAPNRIYLPIIIRNAPTAAPPPQTPTPTATLALLEYRYADGSAESYQSADVGRGFATFYPLVPADRRLVRARFYLHNPAPIQVHIWDQTKADRIAPFTAYPTGDGWFEVDLLGLNLFTTADDFYVGFTYLEGYRPDIGADTSNPRGYSYEVDGAYFEERAGLEYMIGIVAGH